MKKLLIVLLSTLMAVTSFACCIYADDVKPVNGADTVTIENQNNIQTDVSESVNTPIENETTESTLNAVEENNNKATEFTNDSEENKESTKFNYCQENEYQGTVDGCPLQEETVEDSEITIDENTEKSKEAVEELQNENQDVMPQEEISQERSAMALGAFPTSNKTITFNLNGAQGTTPEKVSGAQGTSYTYPELEDIKVYDSSTVTLKFYVDNTNVNELQQNVKKYKNWSLKGWDSSNSATNPGHAPGSSGTIGSSSKTYYAIWNKDKNFSWDDITIPSAPTKEDKTFVCWNTKADGSGTAFNAGDVVNPSAYYKFQSAEILYAIYADTKATITYVSSNHGTAPDATKFEFNTQGELATMEDVSEIVTGSDIKYTYKDGRTTVLIPQTTYHKYHNYTFLGWNENKFANIAQYAAGETIEITKSMTLYAIWQDNGTSYDEYVAPTATKDGYTLKGWWKSSDFTGQFFETGEIYDLAAIYDVAHPTMDREEDLHAEWEKATYNITYDLAGGTVAGSNKTTYDIETKTFVLINPTKAGYTFAGWTGTGLNSATKVVSINKGSFGNREYVATWTPINYSVTFHNATPLNTFMSVHNLDMTEGEKTLPDASMIETRNGFEFVGWYNNPDYTGDAVLVIAQDEMNNVEFWAKWDAINQGSIHTDIVAGQDAEIKSANMLPPTVAQAEAMIFGTPLYEGYLNEGKSVYVWIELAKTNDNAKQAIKNQVGSVDKSVIFDVELKASFDNLQNGIRITEPGYKVLVTVDLTADQVNGIYGQNRNYYVVREHAGKYETIDANLTKVDEQNYRLTFETDKFSTFMLYSKNKQSFSKMAFDVPYTGVNDELVTTNSNTKATLAYIASAIIAISAIAYTVNKKRKIK